MGLCKFFLNLVFLCSLICHIFCVNLWRYCVDKWVGKNQIMILVENPIKQPSTVCWAASSHFNVIPDRLLPSLPLLFFCWVPHPHCSYNFWSFTSFFIQFLHYTCSTTCRIMLYQPHLYRAQFWLELHEKASSNLLLTMATR